MTGGGTRVRCEGGFACADGWWGAVEGWEGEDVLDGNLGERLVMGREFVLVLSILRTAAALK